MLKQDEIKNNIKDILFTLIGFKTCYLNYEEVDKCISYIKGLFDNNDFVIKEFVFNNDKMIYISNTPSLNLDVLFVGHLDVVDAPISDFNPYIKGNNIYGRGSFDMKGHDAVMLSLMKNNKFNCKVGLLLTSDEERGGFNGTQKFLQELGYRAKIAIVPDAGANFRVVEEEKGVLQLKVTVTGQSAHSSFLYTGINAIEQTFRLYEYVTKKYRNPVDVDDYRCSINLAKIQGGELLNKVCDSCVSYYDIRYTSQDNIEDIINCFKKFGDNVTASVIAIGEVFITNKNDFYYKKFINTLENNLGENAEFIKCNSASDGRFFNKLNIPCIMINANGGNIHSDGEYVDLDSLCLLYEVFNQYLCLF